MISNRRRRAASLLRQLVSGVRNSPSCAANSLRFHFRAAPFHTITFRLYRSTCARNVERNGCRSADFDRIERWERDRDEIATAIGNTEVLSVIEPLFAGNYYFARVESVVDAGIQPVSTRCELAALTAHVPARWVRESQHRKSRLAPLAMRCWKNRRRHRRHRAHLRRQQRRAVVLPLGSRTCWSTGAAASPSGWQRTSRRTTSREVIDAMQHLLEHPEADASST